MCLWWLFFENNYKLHLNTNHHLKFIDPNFVIIKKYKKIYYEDGIKIVKTKNRAVLTTSEINKNYFLNLVDKNN